MDVCLDLLLLQFFVSNRFSISEHAAADLKQLEKTTGKKENCCFKRSGLKAFSQRWRIFPNSRLQGVVVFLEMFKCLVWNFSFICKQSELIQLNALHYICWYSYNLQSRRFEFLGALFEMWLLLLHFLDCLFFNTFLEKFSAKSVWFLVELVWLGLVSMTVMF